MRLADFLPLVTDEILIGAVIHLNNGFPTNLPSLQTLRILVIEKDIDILRFDDAAATLWSGSARGIFSPASSANIYAMATGCSRE
jgi:hypothetical protein